MLIVNVINIKDFCEQIRDLLSRLTIRFPTVLIKKGAI